MAIPRECKRLAEVDFPIAVVSKHAARENSIRHGHPKALHLWWARRPLASCRAMLLALLLPDPCDEHCPEYFKVAARETLGQLQRLQSSDVDLRQGLLKFIGDFADWNHATHPRFLDVGRGLVRAAYPDGPPLIVDPFAGGGSIPLEAARLGCEAFASDINPVACLILKVLLEDIPRNGASLHNDLRRVGGEITEAAERELSELYPPDLDGSRPITYLWARTVLCESPGCGAEIPLIRSCWLSKKANRSQALRYRAAMRDGARPEIELDIFQPQQKSDVQRGTVKNAKATCPACNIVMASHRVRSQLVAQGGGADPVFGRNRARTGGARLLAVVTVSPDGLGRRYRLATDADYGPLRRAASLVVDIRADEWSPGLSVIPDEPINPIRPSPSARGLSAVTRYGMNTFGDMFTARQKAALVTYSRLIRQLQGSGANEAVIRQVALCLGKLADLANVCCRWEPQAECPRQLFARQAAAMTWDIAEGVPVGRSSGSFAIMVDRAVHVLTQIGADWVEGQVEMSDAASPSLPDESAHVWFTDPPYYDAIPYADLSDFFLVWFNRILGDASKWRDPFDPQNRLSPKIPECVWNQSYMYDGRPKDGTFFERAITRAFLGGRRILKEEGVGGVVFAHQSTEGWEALLSGLIGSGWTVTASWPVATEMITRMRARDNASLATSVHLVCRPRADDARVGDWSGVLHELPSRVAAWMQRMQAEGVRGADLVFACIGPALEIFSRYSKVVDAEDREIPLGGDAEAVNPYQRGYLAYVWEAVGRAALNQVLGQDEGAGALEEDARLVSLFLWTLQSTSGTSDLAKDDEESDEVDDEPATDEDEEEGSAGRKPKGYTLVFDVARRFAQPLGIHLDDWEHRIIETKKGVVRLLPVAERAKQLFGEDGAQAAADRIEKEPAAAQLSFFPEVESKPKRGRRKVTVTASDEAISQTRNTTTLDRLHIAMLLQSSGRANALRSLLEAEQERGPEFLRLANALSALYPRDSEEKRLLDAMLLAVRR
jgi:putative DNA methylase